MVEQYIDEGLLDNEFYEETDEEEEDDDQDDSNISDSQNRDCEYFSENSSSCGEMNSHYYYSGQNPNVSESDDILSNLSSDMQSIGNNFNNRDIEQVGFSSCKKNS